MDGWVSPCLGIRFETEQGELAIYRPDGQKFLTSVELEQRAVRAEFLLEQERQRAEQEHQRAEQMAEYLRSLGVDPHSIP